MAVCSQKVSSFLKRAVVIAVGVAAVFAAGGARADYTCYVATDGVDAEGRGTSDNPFLTIGYAVSAAKTAIDGGAASATVSVAAGTYSTAAAIAIDAPITVVGATGDPKDVTVNVSAAVRHFTLNNAEAKLEALTINGGGVSGRGGVTIDSAGGRVVNCVLVGNHGSQNGGAVYMQSSSGLFDCCVFSNNIAVAASTYGHAVWMKAGIVRNCLVVNNGAIDSHWGNGGVIYATGGRIENCSFYNNKDYKISGVYAKSTVVMNSILGKGTGPFLGKASDAYFYKDSGAVFATNICPVAISGGKDCIVSDRLFRNAAAMDFLPGDDAQDVANTLGWMADGVDLAGRSRVAGQTPDLGCYEMPATFAKVTSSAVEGTSPLSVTFTVTTLVSCPQGVECEWDWNGDGTTDETTSGTTTHEFKTGSYNVRVKVKDVATGTIYEPPTPMPVKVAPATLYVAPTAAHSAFPYDAWDKAATSLADAVTAAVGGCEIVVSNGTYVLAATHTIDKAVTVRGYSGDPKDVTMNVTGKFRHFILDHASAVLKAMTIDGGKVNGRGGAEIYAAGGTIVNCTIVGNRSEPHHTSGGIDIKSSSGLVDRCTISNNLWSGGASSTVHAQCIYMTAGKLRNCLVVDNGKTDAHYNTSAAIYAEGGRIENCSFYGNKDYKVPGVRAKNAVVVNCTLGKGTGANLASTDDAYFHRDSGGVFSTNVCPVAISGGVGCIKSDKLYLDVENGNFMPGDGALDAAAELSWMAGGVDLAGKSRIMGDRPDIGCYEMPVAFVKVSADVSEGLSPVTVTYTVKVNETECPDGVRCAWDWNGDGTYEEETDGSTSHEFPAGNYNVRVKVTNLATSDTYEPSVPFALKSVPPVLYVAPTAAHSGYPYDSWDKAATNLADAVAITINGCEIVVSNGTHKLASMITIDKGVTVRGLTGDPKDVTMNVTGSWRHFTLDHASSALKALTFDGGSVDGRGGVGIYAGGGRVEDCIFVGNRNANNNSNGGAGAAAYMASSAGFIESCVFTNNISGNRDVAIHVMDMTAGVLRNCLVVDNGSVDYHWGYGGSVHASGGRIENCSFYGNKDYKIPGVRAEKTALVVNCILGGGTPGSALAATSDIYFNGSGSLFATNVCPVAIGGGVGCIKSDKLYLDAENGNFMPGDAALDAAAVLSWMAGGVDLAGKNRIAGDGPDIGCYEMPVSFAKVSADVSEGLAPVTVNYTVTVNASECPDGVRCEWDWNGDGTYEEETDGSTSHEFTAGSYNVRVKVTNLATSETYEPSVPFALKSVPPVLYVAPTAAHSGYPYDTWDKAATNLADAVALAIDGCEIVVSNGTYALSATLTLEKDVTVRGVSGNPMDVTLNVTGSHRHIILNHVSSVLTALTFDGGGVIGRGGVGIYAGGGNVVNCAFFGNRCSDMTSPGTVYMASANGLVDRCVFTNNTCAYGSSGNAGGNAVRMTAGILRNCLIVNNGTLDAHYHNGGTVYATGGRIENCSFNGNKDYKVPGVYLVSPALAVNCILGGGTGGEGMSPASDAYYKGAASCFTTNICPVAFAGSVGHITSDKLFKDAEKGRFQPGADAQKVGHFMSWMTDSLDLAGRPRLTGKKPDLGCYARTGGGFTLIVR